MKQIITEDGSHTLQSNQINDTYHSTHGAITEANTVYIRNGLHCCLECFEGEIHLLEVGFGTGLNALLTCLEADRWQRKVTYYTLEPFPIPVEEALTLNYGERTSDECHCFEKIHQAAWDVPVRITPFFTLVKLSEPLQTIDFGCSRFHLVYFDAFGPDKQPELWRPELLGKVTSSMRPDAVFTTYSTKGEVKRALKSQGLTVEKLPGPPGKREVLRAVRNREPENICGSD
jgi:tRNA U34 5-methylaminomethyl-2-thiouridine-forming methyltransferase MnmC